ncbi:sterol desaturase family protein [bacterium]|nr:sterol desaturase family protein [bacterium]
MRILFKDGASGLDGLDTLDAAPVDKPASVIEYTLWPCMVVITTVALYLTMDYFGYVVGLAVGAIVTFIVAFIGEQLWPLRTDWNKRQDPQLYNDIIYNCITGPLRTFFQQNTYAFLVIPLAILVANDETAFDVWPHQWSVWLQVPLCLLLTDGLQYVVHRTTHMVSWLWPVHALHHSSERLNLMKGNRFHLLDIALLAAFVVGPMMLIGVPTDIILWHGVAGIVIGTPAHCNIRFRFPRFMYYVVMTPQTHAIHHATEKGLRDCNYALFPVWDILFGTFAHPDVCNIKRVNVGIHNDLMPKSFSRQLVAPLMWNSLIKLKK